jgi:hypothetical protein
MHVAKILPANHSILISSINDRIKLTLNPFSDLIIPNYEIFLPIKIAANLNKGDKNSGRFRIHVELNYF